MYRLPVLVVVSVVVAAVLSSSPGAGAAPFQLCRTPYHMVRIPITLQPNCTAPSGNGTTFVVGVCGGIGGREVILAASATTLTGYRTSSVALCMACAAGNWTACDSDLFSSETAVAPLPYIPITKGACEGGGVVNGEPTVVVFTWPGPCPGDAPLVASSSSPSPLPGRAALTRLPLWWLALLAP